MKGKIPAFEIALSAMACALSTLFLSLGVTNYYIFASGCLFSCICLMLPLAKGFWLGDVIAYIATAVLSLLFGGLATPWRILPFVLIFGLHPIINHLQVRFKWNVLLMLIIKTLWFDGALFLIWWVFGLFGLSFTMDWINDYIIAVVLVGGSVFFVLYDRVIFRCQRLVNLVIYRLKR